jgi:hypothetical protein
MAAAWRLHGVCMTGACLLLSWVPLLLLLLLL